jgi:hypothetical protein
MLERVRNVIKIDRKKARQSGEDASTSSPRKRQKRDSEKQSLIRRYPVSSSSPLVDAASTEKNVDEEMAKAKPRDSVLLPILKTLYGDRRMYIMNDAGSVQEILSCYPALKRLAVVSFLCVV